MNLHTVLLTGSLIFLLGIYTTLTRKNLISILMGMELILNGAAVQFAGFALFNNDGNGRVMAVFIITIAALEAAVILALIYSLYRKTGNLSSDSMSDLKK
ncbi:MAG: NADH-quinone oxidoreductase subunit NuoK [Spirochaetia bacterium]|nr:NADH-quinone oxidoreductase subunit NuoK [Spirochaetia bacterium]